MIEWGEFFVAVCGRSNAMQCGVGYLGVNVCIGCKSPTGETFCSSCFSSFFGVGWEQRWIEAFFVQLRDLV